jgi:hypothetical protein
MEHATPTTALVPVAAPAADLDRLGDEIAVLAAHLEAATARLLELIREFDRRGGWHAGFASCAHWLSWRCGLDAGAAREKVRVARALGELPRFAEALARGEISYSKLRALTRVATPATEARLLAVARAGTAAHVERIVRGWRRADRRWEAQAAARRHRDRGLQLYHDEDGMVVLRGRLEPEVGALLRRALEGASDALYPKGPGVGRDEAPSTPAQRQADALALLAETALQHGLAQGPVPSDRYQVVVHVDAAVLGDAGALGPVATDAAAPDAAAPEPAADDARAAAGGTLISGVVEVAPSEPAHRAPAAPPEPAPGQAEPPAPGQSVLEDGAYVPAETCRRLACDAQRVVLRHDAAGRVLNVGRRTRTIPPALRLALQHRDQGCRFPGCGGRVTQGHHLRHWAQGGPTSLENLALLCLGHHRAVHEEGYRVARDPDGALRFARPDGRPLPAVPPPAAVPVDPVGALVARHRAAGLALDAWTACPAWLGERFDLHWAIAVLRPDPGAPG